MTNGTADRNWGETREADRVARRRWRTKWMAVGVVTVMIGLPFALELINGLLRRPFDPDMSVQRVGALVLIAVVLTVAWRNWTEADEVRRQIAVRTWAAVGLTAFLMNPVLEIAKLTPPEASGGIAWWTAIAMGGTAFVWQRVRGNAA